MSNHLRVEAAVQLYVDLWKIARTRPTRHTRVALDVCRTVLELFGYEDQADEAVRSYAEDTPRKSATVRRFWMRQYRRHMTGRSALR